MILYKFRSLQNIEQTLDIILNERLHCAPYGDLNDPFEGLFNTIFNPAVFPLNFPIAFGSKKIKHCQSVENLHVALDSSRICSLSKSLSEIRLWSHYADGNKGIAIEIDFDETDNNIFKVEYLNELPEFGNTILTGPKPEEVLSFKTDHWVHEKEYRIVQKENFHPINGKIKSIYTGHRISDFHVNLLSKLIPKHIPIIPTIINTEKIVVEAE